MSDAVLAGISGPADLGGLSPDQLDRLADELRGEIVDAVLEHGGHLGSNLGAVELTIALHRVFASPHDRLLWDTGHQAYAHKLLTGRRAGFAELRRAEGLSGYPSRTESDHDWIENSHASTVLAYAHGLALAGAAGDAVARTRRTVAVLGDGALTGGMAYEGLNNLGRDGLDCVVVLNDNGRSYAPTASRLCGALRADAATATTFFGALGIAYHGPVDGHDLAALEAVLRRASGRSGPQLVHVVTHKGRGYGPAEADPVKCMHDTSTAAPDSFTTTFAEALVELAADEPRLVAVTAAMPDSTGLLPFAEAFPDRFVDVGIAEQHAVAAAAGMAMGGLVPVVAVYSTFLTRAVDQCIYDVGLHRLPVVFCLDRAGITGDDGPSHHGVLDLALLSQVPGMRILAPSTRAELRVMLRDAVALATGDEPGPVAVRWPKTAPPTGAWTTATGQGTAARRLREGDDLCLVGVGKTVATVQAAADLLEATGVSVTVWDARCARPVDPELLLDAARHPFVLSVEDGVREGGVGAAVADQLAELTLGTAQPPRVRVLGTPAAFIPHGRPDAVLAALGLGPHGVADAAAQLIRSASHRGPDAHPLTTAGVLP